MLNWVVKLFYYRVKKVFILEQFVLNVISLKDARERASEEVIMAAHKHHCGSFILSLI